MKKTVLALMALAAVVPLAAASLADFKADMGRASTVAAERFFVTPAKIEIVEDAAAPNGKALVAKLSALKEGVKLGRYDVTVKLTAEEAAKIREVSFDAKVSDRKAFGWSMLYFRKPAVWNRCLRYHIPNNQNFKIGEWQHFAVPVSAFTPEGDGIPLNEARIFVITFFTVGGPVEIAVANIACAE